MKWNLWVLGLVCCMGVFANPNKRDLMKPGVMKPVSIAVGKKAPLKIPFVVEEGFHVQSNPAAQKRLIATSLKMESAKGFQFSDVIYPKGKPYRMKSFDSDLTVYAGKFFIEVPVEAESGVKKGASELTAKVRYQACNDVTCFFPKSLTVKVPVIVH